MSSGILSSSTLLLVAVCAALVSGALTGGFRRYALARGLLDVPNERSSHTTPTTRGGGVAIVITALFALPFVALLHGLQWSEAVGMIGAGALTAAVGYADDRGLISLLPRLIAHFVAAAVVVLCIGAGSIADVLALPLSLRWLAGVIGVLYAVWMLNLTNFMDGIDGIASTEVITVCAGGALCAFMVEHSLRSSAVGAITLAAATAGFLFWNWPPAKIFMGDAGSGFLGVTLAALSLVAGNESPNLLWSWLILSGVFIVDATVTLLVRVFRREPFYEAHRTHAYQHAAQKWKHKPVTISVTLVNVVWLLPLAVATATGQVSGIVALTVGYAPLVTIVLLLRAGQP